MRTGRIFALALACGAPALAAPVKPGSPAPPFEVRTYAGDTLTLEALRGKVVLINYWATWCGPCRAELPAMDAYLRRNAARGLVMVAVTTEDSLPKYKLAPLQAALAIPLSNHFRGRGYGIMRAVPTSYVIDRAGIVRYAKAGVFDADSLAETIGPLLAEAPPG